MRVLGYVRVSTNEQAWSGASIEHQRLAIGSECLRRNWQLVDVIEDAGSGKDLKRPGILSALDLLAAHDADGLVVAKLDRLSRSMMDFTAIMARARKEGWALVCLDCAIDTTTPAGEAMANVLATFAQFERRLIGQRTKEALAIRKAQGVRLGRPLELPPSVRERIRADRAAGRSTRQIAADLNAEGVPTAHGGARWWSGTVSAAAKAA